MHELKYCNHCPIRANCIYFKKNSFCEKEQLITEFVYGIDDAYRKKGGFLLDIGRTEEENNKSEFYKNIRKEFVEIYKDLADEEEDSEDNEETEGETEDARL
ncbi:MAG: hypothetical protein WCY27_03045 [archaeon]|uniref:hypothetical protein n=1 Tax=Methanoculleus sp. TaxID=90427 RepID=UPI0025E31829|nr:hypothetical protein [Methanoculleus sp.]MCK9319157.1 hypothetical protein [Methanoculleus sp.]